MSETVAPGKPVLSREERVALGKEARTRAPRSSHGAWAPASDRRDPVAVFEEEAADRVPGLVPIRYGRMLTSPLSFFRGSASLMAGDLAGSPNSGIQAQLCGDAHLSNFGLFGSPERQLMFDVNDFDETLPGPVGMGREAARRQLRDPRPGARLQQVRAPLRRARLRPPVPPPDAAVGADEHARGLVRASRGRPAARGRPRCSSVRGADEAGGEGRGAPGRAGVRARPRSRPRQADGHRRRRAAHRRRPAADRSRRGVRPARLGVGADERGDHAAASLLPEDADARPPPSDRGVQGRPRRPEGRRRGQRRHALLHPAAARQRRERSALPAGEGGGAVGARALRGQERLLTITASGSSSASA